MGAPTSKQSSQSSQTTIKDKTLSGLGNLIRLLPTGTVFLYQFLSPVLSNNGHCTTTIYKYLTAIFVAVCGLSCFFSSFTDSYVGDDGKTQYGVVTSKGLWPSADSKNVDLSTYKLRIGDFVHGLFALSMFGVLVLLDPKTVSCFYPVSDSSEKTLLEVFPPAVCMVSSGLSCSSLTNAMELDTLQVLTLHRFPSLVVAKYHCRKPKQVLSVVSLVFSYSEFVALNSSFPVVYKRT